MWESETFFPLWFVGHRTNRRNRFGTISATATYLCQIEQNGRTNRFVPARTGVVCRFIHLLRISSHRFPMKWGIFVQTNYAVISVNHFYFVSCNFFFLLYFVYRTNFFFCVFLLQLRDDGFRFGGGILMQYRSVCLFGSSYLCCELRRMIVVDFNISIRKMRLRNRNALNRIPCILHVAGALEVNYWNSCRVF